MGLDGLVVGPVCLSFFGGAGKNNKRRGQQKKTTTRKIEVVLNQIWKLLKWLDYLELFGLVAKRSRWCLLVRLKGIPPALKSG